MHRELPTRGAVPRRPLTTAEGHRLTIGLSDSFISRIGDNWYRNSCILALDITSTGLRINDILQLRHSDLIWSHESLRLSLWIANRKKDRFSTRVSWLIEYGVANTPDQFDGIVVVRLLWEFVQPAIQTTHGSPARTNTGIFISSASTNSHITYDTMPADGTR